MAEIVRYNGNVLPFALNAATADRKIFEQVPTTDSDTLDANLNSNYLTGFRTVVPTTSDFVEIQHFQAVNYTNSAVTAYLYQKGMPEWNTAQEMYHPCVVLGSDGNIYRSKSGFDYTENPVGNGGVDWEDTETSNVSKEFIATGTGDIIVLTALSGYGSATAYQTNQVIQFQVTAANTGSVTINADSVGAVALNDINGTALTSGALAVGDWVKAVSLNGTTFNIINSGIRYVIKTTTYTAKDGDHLAIDTDTTAAFTVTLPASPVAGKTKVFFVDSTSNFATDNLTIGRNALNIMGLAEDMIVSTDNLSFGLVYIDATSGWRIIL
jgi:hypothetical protein